MTIDIITWLEDPTRYAYLRRGRGYTSHWKNYPEKNLKLKFGDFDRLVGYELTEHPYVGCFKFDVYWLKTHDRHNAPFGVYAGENTFGGHMPSEAVDPRALAGCGWCCRTKCNFRDNERVRCGEVCASMVTRSDIEALKKIKDVSGVGKNEQ